jgi:uncharacterized protein YjiS (DUF1127 family)
MKKSRGLDEVAKAIFAFGSPDVSRSFVVSTKALEFKTSGDSLRLAFRAPKGEVVDGSIQPIAERQLATWAKIPMDYFNRMKAGHRFLLEENVRYWLANSDDKRMLRFLVLPSATVLRAFLSDRYRPLDNIDLLTRIHPRITRAGIEVVSAELTDSRLYLRAVDSGISGTIRRLDGTTVAVQAGVSVANSEVGAGRLIIEGMLVHGANHRAILTSATIKKNHASRAIAFEGDDSFEDAWAYFRDETRKLDDESLWAKVADTFDAALEESRFMAELARLQDHALTPVAVSEMQIVEVATQRFRLTEDEKAHVLRSLIKDGDMSIFGISSAVAAAAEVASTYDRAYDIEKMAGDILNLSPRAFGDSSHGSE